MSAPEVREPPVQPVSADAEPLVPARMVNEYVYCPRLAYMEWIQGEWVDGRVVGQAAAWGTVRRTLRRTCRWQEYSARQGAR